MTTFIVFFQVHHKSVWRASWLPLLRSIHLHLQGEGAGVRSTGVAHSQVCQQIPGFTQVPQALLRYTRIYSGTTGFTQVPQPLLRYPSLYSGTPGFTQVHEALLRYPRIYSGTPGFTQVHQALLRYSVEQVQSLLRYRLCSGTSFLRDSLSQVQALLRYRLAQVQSLLMYRLCPDTGFAQVQAFTGTGFI